MKQRLRRLDYLLALSPPAFEDAIADLYRKLGYVVEQTPYSNDRGRDALAQKDGKLYLIECKRYDKSRSVGRRDLQVFYAAIVEDAAAGGFFVTTGQFTKTVDEFVQGKSIELIDGQSLVQMMGKAYAEDERQEDELKVMCRECGEVAIRRITEPDAIVRCRRGHPVPPDLTEEDL